MYKIFELRSKQTHQVYYLNFFDASQLSPEQAFQADPAYLDYNHKPHTYLDVLPDEFKSLEDAVNRALELIVKYKIKLEAEPSPVKPKVKRTKKTND